MVISHYFNWFILKRETLWIYVTFLSNLGGFKKSCDSHKFVDAMIGTEYSEDEDSGDVFMVNKGGFNIKRVIYFSCCFHICWNKVWLDMNKACNKGLLH